MNRFEKLRRTEDEFDRSNTHALLEALQTLTHVSNLKVLVALADGALLPGQAVDAFALIMKADDVLTSALALVRQRAVIEALALMRLALETACAGLHIGRDTAAYSGYRVQQYKSTDAITFAKRSIPRVGETWGRLSSVAVHVNASTFGVRRTLSAEGTVTQLLVIDPNRSDDSADHWSLNAVCLAANMVLRCAELVLLEETPDQPFAKLPGTDFVYARGTVEAIALHFDRFMA